MSYDIELCDPVTEKVIEIAEPHLMRGGMYAVGGTNELWLNVTYNYSKYYYEANKDGIRAIYGMSGADSIPVLESMIKAIEEKYKKDGKWINGKRTRIRYFDGIGSEIDLSTYLDMIRHGIADSVKAIDEQYTVNEGDTSDYWEKTAANAIRPLHQLIAMAKMRPDGIWKGD